MGILHVMAAVCLIAIAVNPAAANEGKRKGFVQFPEGKDRTEAGEAQPAKRGEGASFRREILCAPHVGIKRGGQTGRKRCNIVQIF